MAFDRYAELKAEFDSAAQRWKATSDLQERRSLLRDIRKIVAEFDQLVQRHKKASPRPNLLEKPRPRGSKRK